MSKFFRYLKMQCLRAIRHYPIILAFTVVLSVSILLFVNSMFKSNDEAEDKKRFEIALVGDLSDTYLDVGIAAITDLDSSQYYVEFSEMEEAEAKEKLLAGKIYGYVLIPEGFVDSILYGENKPLTYVSDNNPASLGPVLTNEIVAIVTKLVIQAQNGIYGMTEIADRFDVSRKIRNKAIRDINMEYISAVLGREGFYELTYVGLGDGLSYKEYYTCVFVILLMLLWGIACSAMLIKHDMALPRILKSSGYRMSTLVIGDYIPFLVMMCFNTFLLLVIGGTYLEMDGGSLFSRMIPMIVLLSTMQFFLYEIATNMISGVLMQLFVAVLLSYASGFFYPIYSLPEMIQNISKMLPTGISFRYFSEILRGKTGMEVLPKVWLYSILFILLSMAVRQYKIRSNKYD